MDLAHKYIDGLASEHEIAELKDRLKTDAKFRKEFMRLQAMKAMLKADERMEMKGKMQGLFDEVVQPKLKLSHKKKEPTRIITLQRIALAVAAAVTLILVITFVLSPTETDNQSLYAAYYAPYTSSMLRGEQDGEATYQAAINQYNQGNYADAEKHLITLISNIEKKDDGSSTNSGTASVGEKEQLSTAYLLLGNCALNQDDIPKAEEYFNKVLNGSNGQYIQDAKWYLAMTYLKGGKDEKAITQLNDIASAMNVYQIEAQQLLEQWGK
ncbi:MAG: tetratricopeptide repeat protein [Flammeovirgaceae bacterium]